MHESDQRRAGGAPLPAGPAGAALGPVRGRPGSAAGRTPRPRLLRASARAAGRQPCLPRDRSQAAPTVPTTPWTSSARRRCSRRDRLDARPSPTFADHSRPAPSVLLPPRARAGRPRKTERPHRILRDHPITHHVADLDNETAHRDKAGRPRASTRPLRPPSPPTTSSRVTQEDNNPDAALLRGPWTDKEKNGVQSRYRRLRGRIVEEARAPALGRCPKRPPSWRSRIQAKSGAPRGRGARQLTHRLGDWSEMYRRPVRRCSHRGAPSSSRAGRLRCSGCRARRHRREAARDDARGVDRVAEALADEMSGCRSCTTGCSTQTRRQRSPRSKPGESSTVSSATRRSWACRGSEMTRPAIGEQSGLPAAADAIDGAYHPFYVSCEAELRSPAVRVFASASSHGGEVEHTAAILASST